MKKHIMLLILLFVLLPTNSYASVVHVVHPGDTLSKIAKQYNLTDISQIAKINGMDQVNSIVPGQALLIPGYTYVVQPGDTLWQIANQHALTVNQLQAANPKVEASNLYSGLKLTIPKPTKKRMSTSVFLVPKDEKSDQWLLNRNQDWLTSVALFEYHPDEKANLSQLAGEKSVSLAWRRNITPYATISNLSAKGFDHELSHKLITTPSLRRKLVQNIHSLLRAKQYKGVVIDFEGLQRNDRMYFNLFIKELSQKLHPSKMKVAIAVMPKQGDNVPTWNYAYDYRTLGMHADFIFVMAYDWHWMGGPAGPIAPIQNVRETIQYAVSAMPKSKVILGVPLYAYDWITQPQNGGSKAYAQKHAMNRALTHQSPIHYDVKAASPTFTYQDEGGATHEVWFEDARSIAAKFKVAKEFGILGIGGWKLGLSFPQADYLLGEHVIPMK